MEEFFSQYEILMSDMPSEEKHVVSTAVCMKLRTKENSPLNNVIRFIRYGDRYNTTEEKPDEDICNR